MKTIIEMARVAGVRDDGHRFEFSEYKYLELFVALIRADERELVLVAAIDGAEHAARKAVADEREAILDLVDSYAKNNTDLADAIRARGNT